jgi:hypothetical protein
MVQGGNVTAFYDRLRRRALVILFEQSALFVGSEGVYHSYKYRQAFECNGTDIDTVERDPELYFPDAVEKLQSLYIEISTGTRSLPL